MQILAITTARNPCIHGDLSTAEELLTQDINTDVNNHTSYAHRSFVMARKHDWDRALRDAINVRFTYPSSPFTKGLLDGDIVHQHSTLTDRLYLQGHRPLRKRPHPGCEGSI
jgi:hypothetical protein